MSDRIYVRRGNRADLPALNPGEPGFALDTKELFIGHSSGNVRISIDSKSLSQNGYEKLASGLILQWGLVNITVSGSAVTFPIAFPGNVLSVLVANASGTSAVVSASTATPSNFLIFSSAVPTFAYYFALGS